MKYNDDTLNLNKKLKFFRNMRNLTQYELSVLSKVPMPTISAIEQERNIYPTIQTVVKLCKALNIKLDTFIYSD